MSKVQARRCQPARRNQTASPATVRKRLLSFPGAPPSPNLAALSRRLMVQSQNPKIAFYHTTAGNAGLCITVNSGKFRRPMSQLGHLQTFGRSKRTSALFPRARHQRRTPLCLLRARNRLMHCNKDNLLDHLVSPEDQCRRYIETNRLSGFQVDHQHELRRLLNRNVGWRDAVENLADFIRPNTEIVWIVWRPATCLRLW